VLFVSAALGFLLCLPVALFAAWRAALLPLWTPIVVTVGVVVAQALQPFGSGLLLLALSMLALSYALWQMDWRPREAAVAEGPEP
jgi:hypothetical protein